MPLRRFVHLNIQNAVQTKVDPMECVRGGTPVSCSPFYSITEWGRPLNIGGLRVAAPYTPNWIYA